jgi:hypothetical protein
MLSARALTVLLVLSPSLAGPAAADGRKAYDPDGHLHVPSDYRLTYEFIGTWAVAKDAGQGAKQLHEVYASPGAVAAYKKTGHFPDGTVLVKEVLNADTRPMTTGTVSHEANLVGWFVMVRDSKNSHTTSKLWGDGWGWSWFNASDPVKTTSTNYKSDCQGCHIPAQASDWIYTYGYPALRGE